MKALLVLLVIFVAAWMWRTSRAPRVSDRKPSSKPTEPQTSIDMVACLHCGVHVALNEAIMGKRGAYCSTQHRATAEP